MMTMVACQLLRTTATRQLQREVEIILNAVDEERLGGKIVGASDADMAASHVRLMHRRMPQTALVLFQMKWVLLVNDTATPFWISDNRVVQHNALGCDIGLLNRGIEVHIPLSPRVSLVLHDPNAALPPYGQCPATDRQVVFENKLQVAWSRRFVFSPNSAFGAAQRLLAQYPNWRYPDRPQLLRVT